MADRDAMVPMKDLEKALDEGGTVLHEGKLIRTKEQLRRAFQTAEEIEKEIEDLSELKDAKAKAKAKGGPNKSAAK